jgi:hypothetical protein
MYTFVRSYHVPSGVRTHDTKIRSLVLYPSELLGQHTLVKKKEDLNAIFFYRFFFYIIIHIFLKRCTMQFTYDPSKNMSAGGHMSAGESNMHIVRMFLEYLDKLPKKTNTSVSNNRKPNTSVSNNRKPNTSVSNNTSYTNRHKIVIPEKSRAKKPLKNNLKNFELHQLLNWHRTMQNNYPNHLKNLSIQQMIKFQKDFTKLRNRTTLNKITNNEVRNAKNKMISRSKPTNNTNFFIPPPPPPPPRL